jgi:hypothetical protein
MTEHIDKVEKRDEELKAERKAERMDNMYTQIYAKWDKDNPYHEDFIETKYASGRVATYKFDEPNKVTTTWERARNKFFKFWDKPKKKEND